MRLPVVRQIQLDLRASYGILPPSKLRLAFGLIKDSTFETADFTHIRGLCFCKPNIPVSLER